MVGMQFMIWDIALQAQHTIYPGRCITMVSYMDGALGRFLEIGGESSPHSA